MGPPLRREEPCDYHWSLPFYWRVTLLDLGEAADSGVRYQRTDGRLTRDTPHVNLW
jgi:hypothetical protein